MVLHSHSLKGGGAAWVLRYRLAGKQREKTIGRFPDISLKRARELATDDRAKIQQGVDVAREKQIQIRESNAAWTVKELASDYEAKVLIGLAAATILSRKQKIRDYVLQWLCCTNQVYKLHETGFVIEQT